jgi:GT2 family glycosyltransferase
VVDNNSEDGTVATLRSSFPNIPIIETGRNLGYPRGNNIGASYLADRNCTEIAFINPDVTVRTGTLQKMRDVLQNKPGLGCVGGMALDANPTGASGFRNKPAFLEKVILGGKLRYLPVFRQLLNPLAEKLTARHYVPIERLTDGTLVYAAPGPCIMFQTSAFVQIGGFDEETFLFQEELIMSERLRRAGYSVAAVPSAPYDHVVGHSMRANPVKSFSSFIASEQHLLWTYLDWGIPAKVALAAFRGLEWIIFALAVAAQRLNRHLKAR